MTTRKATQKKSQAGSATPIMEEEDAESEGEESSNNQQNSKGKKGRGKGTSNWTTPETEGKLRLISLL
jgi:hypothetical protein